MSTGFTPRQQARLQDMFDEADEYVAELRARETTLRRINRHAAIRMTKN